MFIPARGTRATAPSSLRCTEAHLDDRSLFASRTLLEHVTRGVIAAALLAWVFLHQSPHPLLTALAVLAAVLAMRGCPMCWAMGLVETAFRARGSGAPRCDC